MQIDYKKLVDLIVDASGLKIDNVEKQLVDLIDEIKQSLSEGNSFQIEEFGTFSNLDGNMIFIPSTKLETEINFKYVGMEPIDLDGVNSSSDKGKENPEDSLKETDEIDYLDILQDDNQIEEAISNLKVESEKNVVYDSHSSKSDKSEEDEQLNKMFEDIFADSKKTQSKKNSDSKIKTSVKSYHSQNVAKNSKSLPIFLWISLIIIALSGSLIIALDYFSIINLPNLTQQTSPTNTIINESLDSGDLQIVDESSEEKSSETVVEATQNGLNNFPKIEDQYGFKGEFSVLGNDGYTIILYSLRNQTNAISETQKLIDAGYRGFIIPISNKRYGMLYRVCLGQFSSIDDASEAVKDVQNLLPKNYIIKKIN